MGKRARVIIRADAAFLPLLPKTGERIEPIVVERSTKSDFFIYKAESPMIERNFAVSDSDESSVSFPK